MSWPDSFAARYEEWSAHMTADIGFQVELARKADGPVVELAIGNGRVAAPVAQATGRPVIGIDEWLGLLDAAGLQLEALYGGIGGEPFDDDSREYVFIARR